MVGSTARADGADPEDVRDDLRRFYGPVREQIDRFGGTVEKFIGDAVVAVFGAPVAHGDDAERAVRCALQVVEAVVRLNSEDPSLCIDVRAAVNTGDAVVTLGGAHERGEPLATGDVVNTAARLQAVAPPSGVVVSAETYLATRRAIRYQPLQPVEAKGKHKPVEAWLALEPARQADVPRASRPIVGRDDELDQMVGVFHRVAAEQTTCLLTVLGSPGIGKSRLAAEFSARIESAAGHCVWGRCLPYEEQGGYRASVEQIQRLTGVLETDAPAAAREKLVRTVEALLPREEVADIGRYLSLLLGLGIDEPVDARLQLFFGVRRLLEALSRERPLVVVYEDLHWAGRSELDLLEYVTRTVRGPVLFLALARTELADVWPAWGAESPAQVALSLQPLSIEAAAALAAGLLDGSLPSAANAARLLDIAGGNPLFLEELIAAIAESNGSLDRLPTTVHEAVASRIDGLPVERRDVLLDASVIGMTFWGGALTAVRQTTAGRILQVVRQLEDDDLVRSMPQSQIEGDKEFSFKHIVIRDVAYGTLTRVARRVRHAAVASYVERVAGDRVRDLAWLLAHHWREAGERERAVEYLLLAAERARESWATAEVTALYDAALQLVEDDPALQLRIRLEKGLSLVLLTDFMGGAAELDEILPQLVGRDRLEALLARARTAYWLEETEQAKTFSNQARELAERLEDGEMVPPAMAYQSLSRYMAGNLDEATGLAEEARALWVPGSRLPDMAALAEGQADVAYWRGEYAAAEQLSRNAHQLGGELHSVEPLLRGGGWRGLALAALGRTEEAIELLDWIIRQAAEIQPRWGAAPLNYSSMPFRDLFMFEEATRRNEQALELVRVRGAWGMPEMQAEIDLMVVKLAVGNCGPVQARFPALWEAAINGKAWRPWLGAGRLALARAELARQTEGPEATVAYARDALDRARRVGRRKYEAAARALLGPALLDLGRAAEGVAELEAAVAGADHLGTPAARWQTRVELGKARYATGDDDGAALAYRQAAEVLRAWAAELSADHAASLLGAEPVRDLLRAAGPT